MEVKLNSVATPDFVVAVAASACHALFEPSADPQAPSPWAWLLCKKKQLLCYNFTTSDAQGPSFHSI